MAGLKFLKNDLWAICGFIIVVVSIMAILMSDYIRAQSLFWIVLAEGGLLVTILGLYLFQLSAVKKMKAERDHDFQLLEKRLAAIEASAEGIAIVDEHGMLTYINRSLRELHGIADDSVDAFIGEDWNKLYAENNEYVLSTLDQYGVWRGETAIRTEDGEAVMVELSLTRMPDGGIIATERDMTDKHQASQEKEDLEAQFYQAQKMEAVGRLAGGIAHDFNNILAAMNGYAEFLSEDLDPKTSEHEFAMKILQAGRQAKELVDQLLAFSRQKQSTQDSLDLIVPVRETLSIVTATLPKTIDLETDIQVDNAHIDGNETQISQVLMNLCVNAGDAMDEEKGLLKVSMKPVDKSNIEYEELFSEDLPDTEGVSPQVIKEISSDRTVLLANTVSKQHDYVCLCLEDTGSGMSKTVMEHIFEPFFTTKPVDKGTGLGLSTVHGVIVAHKGSMVVDSTLGQGTRFDLYFPLMSGASVTDIRSVQKSDAEPAQELTGGTILLVEDEERVRDMVVHMLKRMGYDAESCANGLEGLMKIKEDPQRFDAVLTDQNMPKMSGVEMAQQASLVAPDLPFIILSGYSSERINEAIKDTPMIKETIRKPVAKGLLEEKLNSVLRQARAA